jgi:hypothetical protein
MNQAPRDAGKLPRSAARPLIALASRTDLPPRVRHLLEGTLGLCSSKLEKVLVATLDDFEAQLFKRAEQLRGGELQYRCFETLREVKRGRSDIAPRFMLALEDTLARFAQPSSTVDPPTERHSAPPLKELSLVQTRELEEVLALQEFSTRAEIRHAQALYALGHRFAVLAASPVIDAEHLLIGPAQFAAALRHACACLEIAVDHRVWLYHAFDRVCADVLGELYAEINRYLIEHRILPHLHLLVAPRPKEGSVDHRPAAAPASAKADEPASSLGLGLPSAPHSTHERAAAGTPPRPASREHTAPAVDPHDVDFFTSMRELLNGRHFSQSAAPGNAANNYLPSNEEVQAVLGTLQARPISPMLQDGKLAPRSVGLLKQELLANLRQIAPNGQAPRLSEEDSDTIDLVGMLFDYLTKNTQPSGSSQSLLTKLQVPLLRVALRDKSFFTRRSHPARQLLNTIAETGNHWLDEHDGAADRGLVDKMQLVVDRVTQDFDGNLALIEDMARELSQHMHTLTRKAEVTERRHVDAARGREKLTLARDQARSAIAARIAAARPSKLVRTLLEQAWTDVLALTLLRHGEKSDMYIKRLAVADKVLATGASRTGDAKVPPALRDEIETALDQVGYHHDDIQTIVKRLFEPEHAHADPSSSTEIAIKLKNKPHLGDEAVAAAAPKAELSHKDFTADSAEARLLGRLRTIPFGTWFEFVFNQQGDRVRRKLAWYSTVSGHALFVNQRGVRTDEKTLHQLAYDVVHGQAMIVEPEQESLVDRAWRAIMTSMRQLVGRDPAAKPA